MSCANPGIQCLTEPLVLGFVPQPSLRGVLAQSLQKELHPPTKADRIAAYIKNMSHEVGIIAHSCGVRNPRELRRFHARVVQPNGISVALNELYPDVPPVKREPDCEIPLHRRRGRR